MTKYCDWQAEKCMIEQLKPDKRNSDDYFMKLWLLGDACYEGFFFNTTFKIDCMVWAFFFLLVLVYNIKI